MITEQMISSFFAQGLGYGAFALLLMYTLKKQEERDVKSEEREKNYQGIIKDTVEKLNIVVEIKEDIQEIKKRIEK